MASSKIQESKKLQVTGMNYDLWDITCSLGNGGQKRAKFSFHNQSKQHKIDCLWLNSNETVPV